MARFIMQSVQRFPDYSQWKKTASVDVCDRQREPRLSR